MAEQGVVVVPVVLAAGTPYLRGIERPVGLELADLTRSPKGSVRLTYRGANAG